MRRYDCLEKVVRQNCVRICEIRAWATRGSALAKTISIMSKVTEKKGHSLYICCSWLSLPASMMACHAEHKLHQTGMRSAGLASFVGLYFAADIMLSSPNQAYHTLHVLCEWHATHYAHLRERVHRPRTMGADIQHICILGTPSNLVAIAGTANWAGTPHGRRRPAMRHQCQARRGGPTHTAEKWRLPGQDRTGL